VATTGVPSSGVVNAGTSQNVIAMDDHEELKQIIMEKSILRREGGYILASGAWSPYYFDLKLTTLSDPRALELAARGVLELIKQLGEQVDAVGGLTSGADPLVVGTSLAALKAGMRLPGFFVRDMPKNHGTERVIEGTVYPGMNVVIVDDVITKGTSVLKAIRGAEEAGARVLAAIILVDREEGGVKFLTDKGYKVLPMFKYGELMAGGAAPCKPPVTN
jgi:orotate phosphoribosyltransferase